MSDILENLPCGCQLNSLNSNADALCDKHYKERWGEEEAMEELLNSDIDHLLSFMNDGHLYRRYVENQLAKDFLFDLMKGIRSHAKPTPDTRIVEAIEHIEKLKVAISESELDDCEFSENLVLDLSRTQSILKGGES